MCLVASYSMVGNNLDNLQRGLEFRYNLLGDIASIPSGTKVIVVNDWCSGWCLGAWFCSNGRRAVMGRWCVGGKKVQITDKFLVSRSGKGLNTSYVQ